MADPKLLAILKEGAEAWNQWRREHLRADPDFREANLSGTNLFGVQLNKANLGGANLDGANLSNADLFEANLRKATVRKGDLGGTNLCKAALGKADLAGANLRGANLSGADLIGANLDGANLSKAQLAGVDLREATLRRADVCGADLSKAKLRKTDLSGADLFESKLGGANLFGANLRQTNFGRARLSGANLFKADLFGANLFEANLTGVQLGAANLERALLAGASLGRSDLGGANLRNSDLTGANLRYAKLVKTNLEGANLTACSVYGISAWNVRLEGAIQANLVITPKGESAIQVDNLEVAQFVYLLLNNEKIRQVIDTITSKVVLILGRFTPERKAVLEAIRGELRMRDYLPVLFDFEKPSSRDLTGTISTLANLARFIIADLTDPSSVPHELAMIVPGTIVPVQPILLEGQQEYAMFVDLKRRFHWVMESYQYKSTQMLITDLSVRIIAPAEAKAKELSRK